MPQRGKKSARRGRASWVAKKTDAELREVVAVAKSGLKKARLWLPEVQKSLRRNVRMAEVELRRRRRSNPSKAAKLGKWYKHPSGARVRVRRAAGRIVVDVKK